MSIQKEMDNKIREISAGIMKTHLKKHHKNNTLCENPIIEKHGTGNYHIWKKGWIIGYQAARMR